MMKFLEFFHIKKELKLLEALFIIISALFVFLIIIFSTGNVTFLEIFKYLLVQIFVILLPGCITIALFKLKGINGFDFFSLGYGVGYSLNIFLYLFIFILNLKEFALLIISFYSFVFLILFAKILFYNYKSSLNDTKLGLSVPSNLMITFIIISFTLFFVQFLTFGINNLLPIEFNRTFYMDTLYWAGNVSALSLKFPPINIRATGNIFGYHYFSSMQLALIHTITEISVAKLTLSFSYIQTNLLLVFSSISLAQRFLKKQKLIFFYPIILFFTIGIANFSYVTYFEHLLKAPFGFDYGLALGMYFFLVLLLQEYDNKFKITNYFLTILFFFLLSGTKSPIAIILLVGATVYYLANSYKNKQFKYSFLYLFSLIVIFIFIYKSILVGYTDTVGYKSTIDLRNMLIYPLIVQIYKFDFNNILKYPFLLLLMLFQIYVIHPLIYTLFLGKLILIKFRSKIYINIIELTLFAIGFSGIAMYLFVSHDGLSQMYYVMSTLPFVLLLGLSIDLYEFKKAKFLIQKIFYLILIISLITSSYCFLKSFYIEIRRGIENITHGSDGQNIYFANYVTSYEYEAYTWIKDNTDINSVLVSNITKISEQVDSMSVFTERQMFIEGMQYSLLNLNENLRRLDLINNFILKNNDSINNLISENIDYFVLLKRVDIFDKSSLENLIVFENEGVIIFKLNTDLH